MAVSDAIFSQGFEKEIAIQMLSFAKNLNETNQGFLKFIRHCQCSIPRWLSRTMFFIKTELLIAAS